MLEDQPPPSRAAAERADAQVQGPVVHKAMLLIEQNLQRPGAVSQCYELLGVGQRQLERRFQLDIGMSPAQYRTKLRLRTRNGC